MHFSYTYAIVPMSLSLRLYSFVTLVKPRSVHDDDLFVPVLRHAMALANAIVCHIDWALRQWRSVLAPAQCCIHNVYGRLMGVLSQAELHACTPASAVARSGRARAYDSHQNQHC